MTFRRVRGTGGDLKMRISAKSASNSEDLR